MPFYFWLLYPNKNNNNETNKDKTSKDETSKDKVKNFYISKKPQYKKEMSEECKAMMKILFE